MNFSELLDIANKFENMDECFIVGCKQENTLTLNKLLNTNI